MNFVICRYFKKRSGFHYKSSELHCCMITAGDRTGAWTGTWRWQETKTISVESPATPSTLLSSQRTAATCRS